MIIGMRNSTEVNDRIAAVGHLELTGIATSLQAALEPLSSRNISRAEGPNPVQTPQTTKAATEIAGVGDPKPNDKPEVDALNTQSMLNWAEKFPSRTTTEATTQTTEQSSAKTSTTSDRSTG